MLPEAIEHLFEHQRVQVWPTRLAAIPNGGNLIVHLEDEFFPRVLLNISHMGSSFQWLCLGYTVSLDLHLGAFVSEDA